MMQYEFLKQFPRRMKHVGRYMVLLLNSSQKTTWKQYGFLKLEEQVNLIFAVMLYIMEQSLKEDVCTIDDIGTYIDNLNMQYLEKNIGYEECKKLGDFILNIILSNEGKPMYFDGYDFEQKAYQIMNISYVANRVVYVDADVKRTSYYLTDDGYNLLLSTLEIENNMKLTIHEMIFKLHLEKQSYDKAVDEIKNVFQLLRIQLQKIQEAMGRIRRNALNYSVKEYEAILDENLETITDTKQKFQNYRELVKARAKELEDVNVNLRKLDAKEEEKLENLRIIEQYLNRTLDEHQKILSTHLDLKALYTKELEQLTQMSMIRRFSLRNDFYDKMLENPQSLDRADLFLRPLFSNEIGKIYNPKKVTELQKPVRKKQDREDEEVMDFGDEKWQQEEENRRREKLRRYEQSLECLMSELFARKQPDTSAEDVLFTEPEVRSKRVRFLGELTMDEIEVQCEEDEKLQGKLIPNVDIFKEIMVELLKNKEIDLLTLQKERSEFIREEAASFQLNEMLLSLADKERDKQITKLEIYRVEDGKVITFEHVRTDDGRRKNIRCSNVMIRMRWEE